VPELAGDAELTNLVDELLYLVEVGSGSVRADEAELGHLLDRLALAMRTLVVAAAPGAPQEIPARNREVLRKVAASRFPRFGSHAIPVRVPSDKPSARVASAIDDIAAIADHLHAVAWLWRNASFEQGVQYLDQSYRAHWGHPMRALQLYLHDVDVATSDAAARDAR